MKKYYTLFFLLPLFLVSSPDTITEHIKTDQFGYRPNDEKIAVISDPQTGYNASLSFTPGSIYEVRDWTTDAVVFTGSVTPWNGGATQTQSGDKVWWFDFSSLTSSGEFYIFDPANNAGSYKFVIDSCVYNDVLKHALRMFYYQRCGLSKISSHAGNEWSDSACHIGALQDTDCRLYNNTNISTSKDLSGGWHDAGDYNKYVNFTFSSLMDLMLAYKENPSVFTDDYNIPESGNGIPDILDEVKYELDWLVKMQQSDGSLLSVIGGGSASPPSSDNQQRLYGPANTSSTYTGAALFSLGAIVFSSAGQTTYASTLQTAAVNAWTWANANPNVTFYNAGVLAAGENEPGANGLFTRHMVAAVFLYDLTGAATYKTYIDNNYNQANMMQWGYVYPFENEMQDGLLYYAGLASATTSVANAIKNTYTNSVSSGNADNLPAYINETDAYRAWVSNNNYTWNSNKTKGCQGNLLLNMNVYNLNSVNAANYSKAGLGYLNYFHGVNPNSKVYLSNMNNYGADNSVTQFYHAWFENGSSVWDEVGVSTFGPPPGFIPGGPNPAYTLDNCCPTGCGSSANNALCNTNVTPPLNQPIQKSYKDFNDSWPVNSWTVTEAGIYTNASYVRLLSKFCSAQGACISTGNITSASRNDFQVYPNPFAGTITFRFNSDINSSCIIRLSDMSGKIVMRQNGKIQSGQLDFDVENLQSGFYVAEIYTAGKQYRAKVVKQ